MSMRSINDNLQGPWFPLAFGGPIVFGLAGSVIAHATGHDARWWILAATALYAATLASTFAFNVPLNRALAHTESVEQARARFERPWSKWNGIRAMFCTIAFVAWLGAVVQL
jgi:uncharacterized membrane protein